MSARGASVGAGWAVAVALLVVTPSPAGSSAGPAAVSPGPACRAGGGVRLVPFATGFEAPIFLTSAPGDPRIFVVEQGGRVRPIEGGRSGPTDLLDLRGEVKREGSEQGLLGFAFHPQFAQNGRLFVHYSDERDGHTVIAEYRVPPGGHEVSGKERRILEVPQPYSNHNGGTIAFSPRDGFLYILLGDGGAGGDPHEHGQNVGSLLGKVLRIGVDGAEPYEVPKDNPFVGIGGAKPEIWALGVRNPWRGSFDPATGDLWLGDVGQASWEEIDRLPHGASGLNLGWRIREGMHCYKPREGCRESGFLAPVVEHAAAQPCNSITGGGVYRGTCVPALSGTYLYSDFCHNDLRSLVPDGAGGWRAQPLIVADGPQLQGVSSFGTDAAGELYVLSYQDGAVYRFEGG